MHSDDYFFALLPERGKPSVLYALEPKGLGTGDIESLNGYVSRLAAVHRVPLSVLFRRVLLNAIDASSESGYWARNLRGALPPAIAGVCPASRAWSNTLAELTTRKDLRYCTLLWTETVISSFGLMAKRRRYCPECFREHMTSGTEPFERLIWQIGAVSACPVHLVKLRDMACKRGDSTSHWPFRSSGTGYCSGCGALAYQCDPSPPEYASQEEIWISRQIYEFLAYGASGGILVRNNLAESMKTMANQLFDGQLVPLGRLAGLGKSQTWSLANDPRTRVSLRLLLRMSSGFGCTLTSLLVGKPVRQSGFSSIPWSKQTKGTIDYGMAEKLLKRAVAERDGSVSLEAIAHAVGAASGNSISRAFPDLSRIVVELRRNHLRRLTQQRREIATSECKDVLKHLADRKLTPTLRNAEKVTGKRWTTASIRAKIFMGLREFPAEKQSQAIAQAEN